jgi:YVTN family beta-propeller protein
MGRILVAALAALLVMVLGVAPSQAQKAYISAGSFGTQVYDTQTKMFTQISPEPSVGMAVSPDGKTVYFAFPNFGLFQYTATTGFTTITPECGNCIGLATPDGKSVYVANSGANNVFAINTATGGATIINVGSKPTGVAVTPDGKTVYVANFMDNTVSVISNNAVIQTIKVDNDPYGVAVSPDGSTVYVTNHYDGTVSVIATATNTVVNTITVGTVNSTFPEGVAVSPDSKTVYVANNGSGTVSVINPATNAVASISVGGSGAQPGGLAVTPDGTTVIVPTAIGVVAISTANNMASLVTAAVATNAFGLFIGPPTLTVAVNGNGLVTSNPSVIDCGEGNTQCSDGVPLGVSVTLTATAAAGSSFTSWSGGGCSGTGPCVVSPKADTTVTATFTAVPTSFMLTVNPQGNGGGTVTSSPSGISCGSNGNACSASFPVGTQVTLAAVADSDSTFAGWGGGCSGIVNCGPFPLNANETVPATFVQKTADANVVLATAILPLSRSVTVNTPATAFATIINGGSDDATTCSIVTATSIPAVFGFQTTDPTTNNVTGAANTPVTIPAGKLQTFVIALTPVAPFPPTDVAFDFTCANSANPAPTLVGIDTLNLSASATPVPDIVALEASQDPGYADLSPATGLGVFAVATINLGSADNITVAANTGGATLPVILAVCQTDPTTGRCTSNNGQATPSVTTSIGQFTTPTFGIFIAIANGNTIPDLPAVNRAFVTFTDSQGVLRGETSVAIRSH